MSEICIFSLHHQPASALLMPILSRPGSVKLPSTGFNCVTTTVLPYQRNHSGRWARQSVRWDNKRVKNMPSEYWLPSCVKHGISYESMTMTDNTARIWAHTFTRCNFCYFAYLIGLNETYISHYIPFWYYKSFLRKQRNPNKGWYNEGLHYAGTNQSYTNQWPLQYRPITFTDLVHAACLW